MADLNCPECGRPFKRAASLGAHRARAHGVSGTSKRSRARRQPQPQPQREPVASNGNGHQNLDRDLLLQTVFAKGMPARQEAIDRAGAWLDEAEQLAKL